MSAGGEKDTFSFSLSGRPFVRFREDSFLAEGKKVDPAPSHGSPTQLLAFDTLANVCSGTRGGKSRVRS